MQTSPLSDWMVSMFWVWLANWQLLGKSAISRRVTSSLFLQMGCEGGGHPGCPGSQAGFLFLVALDSTNGLVTKSDTRSHLGSQVGGSGPGGSGPGVCGSRTPSPVVAYTVKMLLSPVRAQTGMVLLPLPFP